MAGKQTTLELALKCAKCQAEAKFVEECMDSAFSVGEVVTIKCPNALCKEKPWIYCHSCKKRCYRNSLLLHAKRKKHIEEHKKAYPTKTPLSPPVPPAVGNAEKLIQNNDDEAIDNIDIDEVNIDEILDDPELQLQLEHDFSTTHTDNAPAPMETDGDIIAPELVARCQSMFPQIDMTGNEWLAKAMVDTPRAAVVDMFDAFPTPGVEKMKNFWVAELASGEGRCGGGPVYLAARAFQQSKDSQLDYDGYPDYGEAIWHLKALIQYQSMNDQQRVRQSHLITTSSANDSFFKKTYIPPHKQLGKYYGNTGQHSMWNNLPCPKARDVDGVAYISPRDILTFALANGIPIDEMKANSHDVDETLYAKRVHNSSECRKAVDWINSIKRVYFGANDNGAPNSNDSNFGAPISPTVILLSLSDWTDGFGPGKVKNNRNAVDCKSFTISPPKHHVNTRFNTFAVAVGLKKARGWKEVERLFREDLEALTSSPTPILFYSGVLQKVIPCFLRRFAVLSDKVERNGLTGTLGCGGDTHRCFGVSGKISTPACKVTAIDRFLRKEWEGKTAPQYGWSEDFVVRSPDMNGSIFPSCPACRKFGLQQLGVVFPRDLPANYECSSCSKCTNWELLPANASGVSLEFSVHKDYPTHVTEGSPVPPPNGRHLFEDEMTLPFVQLSWSFMKQASRFAYYQASRSKYAWTKSGTMCYLRHCGLATDLSEELFRSAKACARAKGQENIDYHQLDGIGNFKFPASWLSQEISIQDYIEAPMHELFLGIAESNYELLTRWLSSAPASAKLGVAPFKSALQLLIRDLRGFMLSWLSAYPLTGKKGNLGTGSWVAENWVFFVRISQFIYGWCVRMPKFSKKFGADNMTRLVVSYHGLVARLLSHAGVNDGLIASTKLYMKEFLSCVREFDIRVRHQILNASVSRPAERKKTEAWWLKPNYMSLSNLLYTLERLGPLVEWWDGGFKGEKFIQVVKPLLKNGVREDVESFFVNTLDKLYQNTQVDLMDRQYGLTTRNPDIDEEDQVAYTTMFDILDQLSQIHLSSCSSTDAESDDDSGSGGNNDDSSDSEEEDTQFSTNETVGMTKKRTIFVYRNEQQMNEAINAYKPLAGIVEVSTTATGKTGFEFRMVFRKPVKQFACRKVEFNDDSGVIFHGMWCASLSVEEEVVVATSSFADIQSAAKLSAVALPLWYLIGKNHPDSFKYCVITNWWKHRMSDGWYRLPSVDASLYGGENRARGTDDIDSDQDVTVRIFRGMAVGDI